MHNTFKWDVATIAALNLFTWNYFFFASTLTLPLERAETCMDVPVRGTHTALICMAPHYSPPDNISTGAAILGLRWKYSTVSHEDGRIQKPICSWIILFLRRPYLRCVCGAFHQGVSVWKLLLAYRRMIAICIESQDVCWSAEKNNGIWLNLSFNIWCFIDGMHLFLIKVYSVAPRESDRSTLRSVNRFQIGTRLVWMIFFLLRS